MASTSKPFLIPFLNFVFRMSTAKQTRQVDKNTEKMLKKMERQAEEKVMRGRRWMEKY